MSSLRLALKQSLQESGQNASSTDWKKKNKNKARLNMNNVTEDRGTRVSPVNNIGRPRHKRTGDSNDHEDKTNSNGYSSEENEFSAVEEEEEDESAEENSEQDEEGQNDRISPNDNDIDQDHDGDDGGGTSDSSANRNYKQSRKSSESVHDESHKKQHSAANKIQSRWKRKHKSKTSDGYGDDDGEEGSTDDNDEDTDRNKRHAQSSSDKTMHSTKGMDTNMKRSAPPRKEAMSRNKQKQSGGSKGVTTKSMTVVAPDPSIIQWMSDMPAKRCRQNIVPGMRVKVRFATKVVVRRKDSNAEDQEQAPIKKQIVRKKKWFGGLVSAVSKEGSKIRIKYDDGTVEVTKFPDKDVVVDDNGNGDHQVTADCFIPPPPSPGSPPGSPPIGKKSSNILIGAASDLIDTPMQEHNINTMIDLKAAPKIVLQASSDQLDDDRNQSPDDIIALQPSPQSHVSNDEGNGTKIERTDVQINLHNDVEVSVDSPLGIDEKASEDKPVDAETLNLPDSKRSPSPASSHQQISMKSLPNNEIEVSGVPHTDSLTQDDASVDTNDIMSHPRRKRGRPPKHRDIDSTDFVPSIDAKLSVDDSTLDVASVAETKLDDEQIDDRKPQPNKGTLKIRIANVRTEPEKSLKPLESVEERKDDEIDESHDIKRIKKKKKKIARELQEVNQDHAPTSMKFQIQISSHGLAEEDASENVNNQQKVILSIKPMNTELEGAAESLKRKMIESSVYPASLIESPGLSPRQRKKKLKLTSIPEGIEISSLELTPRIGATEGTKAADTISSVTSTKSIRIKKTATNFPTLPLTAKKQKIVLIAKNSSNEPTSSSVLDNSVHDQPETPLDDIKKDSLETPSIRLGRRAAQQANERIASKQEQSTLDQAGKKKKKKKDEENDNVDSQVTDPLEDIKWVECDKCKKWRVIPSSVVDTLPNQWFCSDNIYDPKRAHCDVPQQTDKQVAKERKRKLKKQQQMVQAESSLVVSSEAETVTAAKLTPRETKDVCVPVKEKAIERARSPLPDIQKEDSPIAKTKRESPVELAALSESGSEAQVHVKQERRLSSIGKKEKVKPPQSDPFEKNPPTESGSEVVRRGRGRPRRNHGKELPIPGSNNGDGSKPEDDNVEWVKCDKCGKWRRLPSHISADDLPDLWYCEMNTWNPDAASCDEPGDTADGGQDGGFGGIGGMGIGKLTYRNLIFGSTGRKQNRQVSERARAAESLFSVHYDEDEAPTRVLYADSCAFVSRGRPTILPDDNEHKTVLELMGHSHMWTELRNAAGYKYFDGSFRGYNDRKACTSSFTFDTLPQDVVHPMKDMVLFFLGESLLSGEQLLSRGQAASVNNLSSDFEIAREFWNINVVVTTIAQLVQEGIIECVQKRFPDESIDGNDSFSPYYRKVVTSSNRSTVSNESGDTMPSQNRSSCRCMKISKPWKVKANAG